MYNEVIKVQWIKEYLLYSNIASSAVYSTFGSSEKLEELFKKDICNFTKPEIEDLYKSIMAKSKERISVMNSVLKEYKSWCIQTDNGICYDKTPYFDILTMDDFKRYISRNILENKYIGEETLISYLKEIDNPCDKLLLKLLYHGVKGKQLIEIINFSINQVDGNVLHLCTGRDVTVDDETIQLINESLNTYEYYSYGDKPRKWELIGDDVFKGTKGVRSDSMASIYHRYTSKMVRFQNMFDNPELAMNRISISGMLNTLIKNAKQRNIQLDSFIKSKDAEPILAQYEFNRYPTKVLTIFEEYIDYLI
jgi:hypothetical protein